MPPIEERIARIEERHLSMKEDLIEIKESMKEIHATMVPLSSFVSGIKGAGKLFGLVSVAIGAVYGLLQLIGLRS